MINRLLSRVLNWDTPSKLLYGTKPDLSVLRPFGCLAHALNTHPSRDKFDSRSLRCVFLGYDAHHKGYLLFDLTTSKLLVSRDVKFDTAVFPFGSSAVNAEPTASGTQQLVPLVSSEAQESQNEEVQSTGGSISDQESSNGENDNSSLSSHEDIVSTTDPTPPASTTDPTPPNLEIPQPEQEGRKRKPPLWMKDYVGCLVASTVVEDTTGVSPPTFPFSINAQFSSPYTEFLFNLTSIQEPASYKEASGSKEWREAMDAEIAALEENNTWELVTLPAGKRPIGSKWVYKVKLTPTGKVERYKARLVAKGYNQSYGID